MSCGDDVLHVGDYGTKLLFTIVDRDKNVVDISTASTLRVLMKKPDDSVETRTATLETDGTDGKLYYTTVAADLDVAGRWEFRAEVTSTSPSFHYESSSCKELVYDRWTS